MTAPLVFSIRPAFVDAFRNRTKRFEFRTRKPSVRIGETVLIYETAPVSKIVAEATVEAVIDGTPGHVWTAAYPFGGIAREVFDAYFAGRSRAVAIRLDVRWLDTPVALPAGMSAPQAWARYKGDWPRRE